MAFKSTTDFPMNNLTLATPPTESPMTGAIVAAEPRSQQLASYQPASSMAPPPQPAFAGPVGGTAAAPESIISLADLIGYLRRYWRRGVLLALPLAVLAFVALGTGPKVYQSEAQLLLRIQDANVFNFEQLGRNTAVGELSAPLLVNSHLMELKSRSFLEFFHDTVPVEVREKYIAPDLNRKSLKSAVMDWAGLSAPKVAPDHREVFIKKLAAVTRVEPLKESFILRVQVRGEEPMVCADMANRYVKQYIDYVAKQELSGTRAASEFLTQKAAELRRNLQESEAKLATYRQQASVMSRADGVKDTSGEKLTALNQALADTEVKLTRARYELEGIESAGTSQTALLSVQLVAQNAQVVQKRVEISALEAQLTPLLEFCGPRHPKVVGITNEVRARKLELNTLIGSVITMARQEVATLSSQLEDFKQQVSGTRGDVIAMGDKEIQEKMLIDQVELDRQMYQNISMRMNQANLTGQFTDNGILRIADVATPPDSALKPNKTLAALASMMVFGLVSLAIPLGWGLTEDHVLKHLRAPAAGPNEKTFSGVPPSVPEAESEAQAANTGLPALPPPVALTTGNRTTVLAEFPRLVVEGNAAVLAECLKSEPRGAATSLRQLTGVLEKQALCRTGPGGIILVTSSESGEGKSLASAALAATFVHHGRKVLVIDCHAGAPGIHHFFPHSERHSSFASRLDDIRYGNSGLFVLPVHDIPAYETNELLDGYRAWIDRARQEVDWIILDGPPVLKNFADVAPLAPLATDVIMIHDRARATPAKLRAAMTLLQPMMSSTAMRGLVINRVE
jgi:uncharacterized protein involved in exopolysaccharide biosynthesis/Mrp family chromosome partitioning ATPase